MIKKEWLLYMMIFILSSIFVLHGQQPVIPPPETSLVNWISFEKAIEMDKTNPKPIMIDFYTDWCGWCKHMMRTTFSNPNIAAYLNANFYPVRFDAETKDTIIYQGVKYYNENKGPRYPHQLAVKLLNNKMSYPSILFINNASNLSFPLSGYRDAKGLEPYLVYTLENVFLSTQPEEFERLFNQCFYQQPLSDSLLPVSYSIEKALTLNTLKPKKIALFLTADFCYSCKVYSRATMTDSIIKKYLDENYYLVQFNAFGNDTVRFGGYTFPPQSNAMHPFASAVTSNKLILPSLIIIKDEKQFITSVPYFQTPAAIEPILHFFHEDAYQRMNFDEYRKTFNGKVK